MGYLRVILAAASILVLGGEEAQAQFSADLCKIANTTMLVVTLRNGFKEVFALSREGSKITGRVQAWQVNGITAGRGNVTGSLGAPQGEGLTLQIYWEGRSDIDFSYFKGILHNGEAQGTASDLNRPFNPVDASAATVAGCDKWPETAFCQDYASNAVAAAKENVQLRCGNNGPRWTADYVQHLNWCLSLGAVETGPNSEAAARTGALKACHFCRSYATKAVAAAKESVQLGCAGNDGPRWSDNFNEHQDWCMTVDPASAASHTDARKADLETCRADVRAREEAVQKPGVPIGDIVKPVDPLDKLGVIKKPRTGIDDVLKETKP